MTSCKEASSVRTCVSSIQTNGPSQGLVALAAAVYASCTVLPSCPPCAECSHCLLHGVVEGVCEHTSGRCLCSEHVLGDLCDSCEDGYFNVTAGCGPCQCSPTGTAKTCSMTIHYRAHVCHAPKLVVCALCPSGTIDPGTPCDPVIGSCECKPGVGGRDCDQCLLGYFNFTVNGCSRECRYAACLVHLRISLWCAQ